MNWPALNFICAMVSLIAVLWTRATVAELRAEIGEKQEARCKECHREAKLVSQRVSFIEGGFHRVAG